ncbi:coiled-coil domain-containing protein 57 isoform X4 [Diceros bicornis minor]|uniref:coiled-coil domain-containing protein 57 isoform X4 n=1 Tax=Diceros bicornis minor TaxID=77932 RepID=UPI0026EE79EA|nr:coiled-coil domain-containing protein 57 isoform X4 [Diceros bicornis minor]
MPLVLVGLWSLVWAVSPSWSDRSPLVSDNRLVGRSLEATEMLAHFSSGSASFLKRLLQICGQPNRSVINSTVTSADQVTCRFTSDLDVFCFDDLVILARAATMLPPPSEQALNELLVRKEEEWRALQAHRSQLQEAALQEAQNRLEEAQGKLRRLQEDFVYNLQVLEERDCELELYDAVFAQARGLEEARQAEVSELKIEVAKLRQALTTEARRLADMQQQYQLKLQEHCLELDRVHSDKNSEIDHQREQYENLKWKLERRLKELDGELALQRQELLLEFECETQKREHEFRLWADGMSNVVLTHELKAEERWCRCSGPVSPTLWKCLPQDELPPDPGRDARDSANAVVGLCPLVKLLNKELVALKEAGAKAAESLQSAEMANSELEKRLQHRAWELRNLTTVRDARIKDLEGKLHSVQLTRRKEKETCRKKHEELDHRARERDEVLAVVKGAHVEQLRVLEARALELQAHCETLELQLRRAERRQMDALKEKNAVIDKLREDAAALKSGWDAQIARLSKEMISKDLQVHSLREEEVMLKAQLARCQQDIGRYKQQLSLAAEREQSLERDKVQLELDWQRRCEGLERDQFQRSEDLIQALITAKEQVTAKLQETERTLCDREVVLKALTLERDQAVQALRTHGPLPKREVQRPPSCHEGEISKSFPSSEIQRLQEQNSSLRNAVAQMRKEMETLSDQILPSAQSGGETSDTNQPDPKTTADAATPDYVLALEAEIRGLKHKFKTLEEQLEDMLDPSKMSLSYTDVQPSVHTSTETTGHVWSEGLYLQSLPFPGPFFLVPAHWWFWVVATAALKLGNTGRKKDKELTADHPLNPEVPSLSACFSSLFRSFSWSLCVCCPGLLVVSRERSGVESSYSMLSRMRSLNWFSNVQPTLRFWNKLNMWYILWLIFY